MDWEIVQSIRYSTAKELPDACERCGAKLYDLDHCYRIIRRRGRQITGELLCTRCYMNYTEDQERIKNNHSVATRSD